jgi:hypothetical protein
MENLYYMIYGYIPKSKPKKLTKVQQQEKEQWLLSLDKISEKRYSKSPIIKKQLSLKSMGFFHRETTHIPSLNTGFVACVKKSQHSYTGDKLKGIGTMHKSNAVPIFTDNEAKDIARMRR